MHRRGCLLLSSLLWMLFTPCYAAADTRSKGRPWVPNPAATASLLADLVNRSSVQALAVSMPDGVPQRVVSYVELTGGGSSSSAAMGGDTQEAKELMFAAVPHLHRSDFGIHFVRYYAYWFIIGCILRNLEGNLPTANKISHETLMGCAKYTTMQPQAILIVKLASLCRSTTFLHTKTFTLDFGLLWFKAFRLLAEWSSLVTLHLPLLYILAFSSSNSLGCIKCCPFFLHMYAHFSCVARQYSLLYSIPPISTPQNYYSVKL
uniref:Uncharacterized protein n=1 Tax=Oryza nivara TaxID=4536 RepID=A0A0E0HBY7_ORYNI